MATFVIGFGIVVLCAAGLGAGLLLGGRPLRRGCGGDRRCGECERGARAPGRSR